MTAFLLTAAIASAPISPCDLIGRHAQGASTVVLHAVYASFYHGSLLYDPKCNDGDAFFDVGCDPLLNLDLCAKGLKQISRKSAHDGLGERADVRLEGRLEPWNGFGFGHLGGTRFQFLISRVLDVRPVKASSPWPKPVRSQFMASVEAIQTANLSFLATLVSGGAMVPGFRLVGAGTAPLPPICSDVQRGISSRIFPSGPLAFVERSWSASIRERARSSTSTPSPMRSGETPGSPSWADCPGRSDRDRWPNVVVADRA